MGVIVIVVEWDLSDISHRVLARRNNISQSLVRRIGHITGVESSQLYNRLDYLPVRHKEYHLWSSSNSKSIQRQKRLILSRICNLFSATSDT